MLLIQNSTDKTDYISSLVPLNHTIIMKDTDYTFLKNHGTQITAFWFQNCKYIGKTNDLTYVNLYDKENDEYEIEALVVTSFEKIPEPTTTTTTTTAKTTTPKPTTTSTTATQKPITTSTTASTSTTKPSTENINTLMEENQLKNRTRRDVIEKTGMENIQKFLDKKNVSEIEILPSGAEIEVDKLTPSDIKETIDETIMNYDVPGIHNQPFICLNKSVVVPDPKKMYGYFRRKVIVKIPIPDLTITGSNWLQHGDVLNLQAKCIGSLPLNYCVKLYSGVHNVTGNETCELWRSLKSCSFSFTHFFQTSKMQTVPFVFKNPIAKVINQVAINLPVSFSLAAVILVVFGVAYYIQSRNRFIVEVADFNFGETQSVDMEYRTFQQRLFDSVREVLHRPPREASRSPSPTGESSLKYGSMK